MLRSLKALFAGGDETQTAQPLSIPLACAALLLEVSRSDFDESASEVERIEAELHRRFGVSPEAVDEILARARHEHHSSNALHPFTRAINEQCSEAEKIAVIEAAWTIAWVDGRVDKYEEALIRKVADLIYVSHSDFIRTRLKTAPPESGADA